MSQCAVLSPTQGRFINRIAQAERAMMVKIDQAIQETAQALQEAVTALSVEEAAPHQDYFVAMAHRALFFRWCGADPETGAVGDPAVASAILGVHTHPDRTTVHVSKE